MKYLFKNKIALWIMFGLFLWWFLLYLFDGSGGMAMNVLSLALFIITFLLSTWYLFHVVRACPWKKQFQQDLFPGIYLFLFSLGIFFYGPYFSLTDLLKVWFRNGADNIFYLFINLDSLFFILFWISGSVFTFFSSLLYLGILRIPSFTFSIPEVFYPNSIRQKIGRSQIVFGVLILTGTFLWTQNPHLLVNSIDREVYTTFIKDILIEQYPSSLEDLEKPEVVYIERLIEYNEGVVLHVYGSLFLLGSLILFVLSIILILAGIVNLQTK